MKINEFLAEINMLPEAVHLLNELQESGRIGEEEYQENKLLYEKDRALFYEKIAEQIPAFDKSQALMVGDSLTADIAGGNNAGIDTAWYNPKGLTNQTQARPTYILQSYLYLLVLLLK